MIVKFFGPAPVRMSAGASGFDLVLSEDCVVAEGQIAFGKTGLHLAVPEGIDCQLRPRSSLFKNWGCIIPNSPGTIDSDYRGEVTVPLLLLGGGSTRYLPKGTRVAQLVFTKLAEISLAQQLVLEDLGETDRGHGGFGSTGRGEKWPFV